MKPKKRERVPVEVRNKQPDLVRKAGPHVKPTRYEPEACYVCGGEGSVGIETCANCQGTGEV